MNKNDLKTVFSAANFLDFFKLPHNYVQDISLDRIDGNVNLRVTLIRHPHECPCCRNETTNVKDYKTKELKHQIINNENCIIHYKARRYKCHICGKSFAEQNPFLHRKSKMTSTTVCKVLDDLKNSHETFASVAQRYFLSPTTVVRIFDKFVNIARKPLPRILCIDEVYYRKGQYACVLLDFETQEIIDILPDRRKDYLDTYFHHIPKSERDRVEILCTDMWRTYINLTDYHLKNAVAVVDKFHVVQVLGNKLRNVKMRVKRKYTQTQKRLKKIESHQLTAQEAFDLQQAKDALYLINKFGWMLNKTKEFSYYDEKRYNHYFKRMMNYWDINNLLLSVDEELDTVSSLMEHTSKFYKFTKYEDAKEELEGLIQKLRATKMQEMIEFSNTLVNYKPEIINSFKHITKEQRIRNGITGKIDITTEAIIVTNGIIENRNKVIKEIKRNANGYQNWSRFRNRVLYSANKDSRHSALELDYNNIDLLALDTEDEKEDDDS